MESQQKKMTLLIPIYHLKTDKMQIAHFQALPSSTLVEEGS